MSWTRVAAARLRGLLERKRLEREMDDEVRFHLEMQMEDNLKAGMNPTEARYAALRSFGGVEQMKERHRERRAFRALETIAQDVRYAARTLRRNPGFAATSVTVLALAIGANTAMFSVLNAVLFQPLPYQSPEQLAVLWSEIPDQGVRESRSAYGRVEQWRSRSRTFADFAVLDPVSVTLMGANGAEKISAARISPNYFPLLGIQPIEGRSFTAQEADQRQRLVLISHRFWQSRFGGSRGALGSSIELDGHPWRIAGVLPPLPETGADVWEPHTLSPDWEVLRGARGTGSWFVVGRLRPGATFEKAQAEMSALARQFDEQLPAGERNRGISVVPLAAQVTGPRARLALWMLTGAVFLVLVLAATNAASLALARGASRAQEIAVRAALGASRARIVGQLLAESGTLAVLSGLLGLLVAFAGLRFILAAAPGNLARLNDASLDPHALGWALALCLITGIGVGLAPSISMAQPDLRPSGREGGRGVAGGAATRRIRRALVVAEFAIAIALLSGAGLLMRSLWSVQNVALGFQPEGVLSVQLATPPNLSGGQRTGFYNSVLAQIASLPGAAGAGIVGDLFIGGSAEQAITAEGTAQAISERLRLRRDEVSEDFFETLGIPLLRGRFFSNRDGSEPDSPRVAIINEALARRLWPGRDPVGQRFKFGSRDTGGPWFTVTGVVGDMRRQGLELEPIPQMFEPLAQNPSGRATLLVRTSSGNALNLLGSVRAAVHRVDRYAPVYDAATLESRIGAFVAPRRFQTALLIGFSGAALLIAAIGMYGLIQYSVAARTHEIGIRLAAGAGPGDIFRMIAGEGLRLSIAGLALGLVGALWLGRAGASLLYGVSATDPATFATVSLLLTAVAAAACYFPARRAMKIDPIAALRQE